MEEVPIRSTKKTDLLEFLEFREFSVDDLGDGIDIPLHAFHL